MVLTLVGGVRPPRPMTAFIGREPELAKAADLLERASLLTITGPGGCGKTRLALRLIEDLAPLYPGGVALAQLESIRNTELVTSTLVSALAVSSDALTLEAAASQVSARGGALLLLVDNCEHMVETIAHRLEELLEASSEIKVLVTSREALNIPGEVVWRLPSLALPDADAVRQPADVELLLRSDAVRLFCARAVERKPDFQLSPANGAAVAGVCRHLGGIPLAIELAAARVGSMAVEDIASHLRASFRLLTGGARTAIERHQALRATMDWSYDLLDLAERVLFARLSVFSGGFDLQAAEAVCPGGQVHPEDVADLLGALVAKSMLLVEDLPGGRLRYRLIEPLRQYAQERLGPEDGIGVRRRHAGHYLGRLESYGLSDIDPEFPAELAEDDDNLRAALEWSAGDDRRVLARLVLGLRGAWVVHSRLREGIGWTRAALSLGEMDPSERARLHRVLGILLGRLGDRDGAIVELETTVDAYRQLSDPLGLAWSLIGLSVVYAYRSDNDAARRLLHEAISLSEETSVPPVLVAGSLNNLALIEFGQGNHEEARELIDRSLELARLHGRAHSLTTILHSKAGILAHMGQRTEACALYLEALELAIAGNDASHAANALEGLGVVAVEAGQPAQALAAFGAASMLRSSSESLAAVASWLQEAKLAEQRARAMLSPATADAAWNRGAGTPMRRLTELRPNLGIEAGSATAAATARERECAVLLAEGLSNKEIASRLRIGVRTVETHLENLRLKLNLRSRAQIAAWAADAGLTARSTQAL